jgi:hypothetical protein
VFLVNLPVIALVLAGSVLFVRPSADPRPHRFDPVGNALGILAIVTLVFGLIEGPVYGWGSPQIVLALGLSLVFWTFFGWWEARTPAPMLDVRVFRQHRFAGACVAISAAFFGLFGFVFMVTQYLQFAQGYSALQAGLRTLPFAGFILCGAAVAARLGSQPRQGWISAAGLALMGAGFAWVSQDTQHTPYLTLVWQMSLLGVGLGLVNAAATEVIMNALPASRAGLGSSINDTTRELGGTLGVAAMGSMFNSVYRGLIPQGLAGSPMSAEAVEAMRQSLGGAMVVLDRVEQVAGKGAAAAARVPVVAAFERGFHASAWVACGGALLGAALTVWLMSGVGRSRTVALPPAVEPTVAQGA